MKVSTETGSIGFVGQGGHKPNSEVELDKNEAVFIEGLTKLTEKTGIAIGGCGCCGSPSLSNVDAGHYRFDKLSCVGGFVVQNIAWREDEDA